MGVTHSTYIMENKSFPIIKKIIIEKDFDNLQKAIDEYVIDRNLPHGNQNRLWLDKSAGVVSEIMRTENRDERPFTIKLIEGNQFTIDNPNCLYIKSEEVIDLYQKLILENYLDEVLFLNRYMKNISYKDRVIDNLIETYLKSDKSDSLVAKAREATVMYFEKSKIERSKGNWISPNEEENALMKIDFCYLYMKELYAFYEKNHQLKDVWYLIIYQ